MGRVKRICYLSPRWAAKVQASLRIRAVSPEPPLLAHTSSESRGTFRQKARSLAPLNGWACAFKICHDGMLEDTNSLDGAQMFLFCLYFSHALHNIDLLMYMWLSNSIYKMFPRDFIVEMFARQHSSISSAKFTNELWQLKTYQSKDSDQPANLNSSQEEAKGLGYLESIQQDWSDCADMQADLSHHWVYM